MEKAFGFGKSAEESISHPFAQQKLPAWQPVLNAKTVIIFLIVIGFVCLPMGIGIIISSSQVQEIQSRNYESCTLGRTFCPVINLTLINVDMQPPIYIYYKLENFFQNNRRYTRSVDPTALYGKNVGPIADCEYFNYFNGSSAAEDAYYPCGLQVQSVFNDTYKVFSLTNGSQVSINKEKIAWKSDYDFKFNNPSNTTKGIRVIPDHKDPDFMVWMRLAGLPTFRKFYGIIDVPLKGDYVIEIKNNFPVKSFKGKKYVVLTQQHWLGGKNPNLGYAYIFISLLSLVLGAIFAIKEVVKPRVTGNTTYLNWGRGEVKRY